MRSTLTASMLPSARNGVGAIGKTPLASTESMESALAGRAGAMMGDAQHFWQAKTNGESFAGLSYIEAAIGPDHAREEVMNESRSLSSATTEAPSPSFD